MTSRNSTRKTRLTQEQILERFKNVHGDRYLYDNFIFNGVDEKATITCRVHGDFRTTPYHHSNRKQGCGKCSGKGKLDQAYVISQFIEKHGNTYRYDNFIYKNDSEKALVTCIEHGDFLVKPNNHKNGSGCPKCGLNRMGYGASKFRDRHVNSKSGGARLYVIKCQNDSELFYKIGITTMTIKRRFDSFHMPYDYSVVYEITGFDPDYIWQLEHKLHKLLKSKKAEPLKYFRGRTECFSEITKPVHKLLKELSTTEQLQLIA